ncbi:sigma-70 family RNA polymerase sigma factor [Bacillus sp. FJAT-47783]|uniref:sigma-70 family RNA polymerase sigma factor n=1 Tax=Bacillus sp. FJAT-47783 TaxID=2922712 RepID=UPI001FAE4006|nr:sigma-70 family RNA polymerase sigma factor [Bacillus sp. FJAT-47783]
MSNKTTEYKRNKVEEFFKNNKEALENPIIKSFLENEENYELLIKALEYPIDSNKKLVDKAFSIHYRQIKKIKYINNLIHYFSIDYDRKIRKLNQRFLLTLDQPLEEGSDSTMKDVLIDNGNEERYYGKSSLKEQIENEKLYKALDILTQKQTLILDMLYVKQLTLNEISNILGTTPQNISNQHKKALKKLYKELSREGQN